MKAGLNIGHVHELDVVVTQGMVVEFVGRPLHPFYPTYWACHHAEYVCRQLLEPFLEEHEDGIGSGLLIHHHAPALVGQKLRLRAVASRVREHHLACDFTIKERERLIAHGEVHQVIVPKQRLIELQQRARD